MAKDLYHQEVKIALEKEGWTITHDPYEINLLGLNAFSTNMKIDLGAEKMLAAEKGAEKIAVEIKTLSSPSLIYALHNLMEQYVNYRSGLRLQEPDRTLFVAIPYDVYQQLANESFFQFLLSDNNVHLIVYEPITQTINSWHI